MTEFKDEEADVQETDLSFSFKVIEEKDRPNLLFIYENIAGEYCPHHGENLSHLKTIRLYLQQRYIDECAVLGGLASKALNDPKNVTKQAGRDYPSWIDIIAHMREEIDELEDELTEYENGCFENAKRCKEELGDVGACGVLLLDWIQSREEK